MRLAWFSPMPPIRSGIASCSAELVAALRCDHDIDVFVHEVGHAGRPAVRSAHDFVWEHRTRPYDLTIYQLGNSSHHDYQWPYLFRYPGLTVLHDAHLHHARAALLLRERRADDYRAEFTANEPAASADGAELAIAGFDSFLHFEWPFTRLVASAARMVAVHSRAIRDEAARLAPGARVEHLRLGHGVLVPEHDVPSRRARARQRHGIAADAIVFGCFGGLTPDKRVPQILAAFAAVLPYLPSARLLLCGEAAAHYDLAADIRRHDLGTRVVTTGYVESDDELTDCVAASDVTLNLRWPTAREVSGPWLRCLAAGRASIVIDLSHLADVPSLDPRTWNANAPGGAAPVTVAIDILDEDHSLRLAMRRLGTDADLRRTLGRAARDFWVREHSPQAMLDDYRRLLPEAASAPLPAPSLPGHITGDGSGLLARILGEFGVPIPWSNI
jgi:glycosyltransferase involved in cell wall biosynthesis